MFSCLWITEKIVVVSCAGVGAETSHPKSGPSGAAPLPSGLSPYPSPLNPTPQTLHTCSGVSVESVSRVWIQTCMCLCICVSLCISLFTSLCICVRDLPLCICGRDVRRRDVAALLASETRECCSRVAPKPYTLKHVNPVFVLSFLGTCLVSPRFGSSLLVVCLLFGLFVVCK